MCKRADLTCVNSINIRSQKKECLKPCEGLYLDVKKSSVEIVESAENNLLKLAYIQNYTWFQEDTTWIYQFQGNSSQDIDGNF